MRISWASKQYIIGEPYRKARPGIFNISLHVLSFVKHFRLAKSFCSFKSREMIFSVQEIVSFLSNGTTLEKGTLIMTGTPHGIGALRSPPVVLNHGDDIRVWIEGI